MAIILAKYEPMRRILKPGNLNDYGNLMLTFVMLWGWFTFSQWLIIWAGNLPDEISWYLARLHHGWRYVGFVLLMFYFVFPFVLLLSKNLKRNPKTLIWLAAWMLVMRWVDLFWNIEPAFNKDAFHISWLDFVIPIAIGGFWMWLFYRNLRSRPLVPLHDPRARAILGPDID
jgi:peptidoglycan/LPS O-acetylase OafA/YrhL